ncbi:MATE family efflux transporter [Christensenella sp. MSJ-20]|uniref:MATE family efflux transporter n=1 Tax=Christensenella sp. MSJ-20 TaxID=2841518 RepID=UPI001C793715|nr:MATE family efflux transporter [Christensenella sp. MSJ-20]
MEQIKENKMGTNPVFRLIISMSLPAIFSMLIQSMYNIVDSIFVAKIGEDALAAVSLASPVQFLLIAFGVGTGVGINSLISRRLGEKNREAADSAATHGLFLAVVTWAVFAVLGLVAVRPFFALFHPTEQVMGLGIAYTQIVMVFSMGVFVQIICERMLQATGNMIYPMIFQLMGAVINIILDPILIFGLLGFPKLGVAGAAIATVLGQIIACIFSLYIVLTKDHEVSIQLRGFRPQWEIIKQIYVVGAPSIVMQSVGSFLLMAINGILIGFSQAAVSVMGVYQKLQSFVFMPVFGLNNGVMPIMGYNFGARKKERLLSALKIGGLLALGIMFLGLLIFWIFPRELLMIFSATPEMLEIGIPALRTISLCFVPAALGIMVSTFFQGVGNGKYSLYISMLRQVVIILPVAYLFSKIGLSWVWWAYPIAEGVSLIASLLLFLKLYRAKIADL